MNAFFGLNAFQIFALIAAGLTLLLLIDAFVGHYRSGFVFRSQFAPFASGGLLVICAVAASIFPNIAWLNTAMRISAWLAIFSSIAGFGFHHFYGIAKKPGGYGWVLHYLMYGAPQFAPIALSATGFLALVSSYGLAGASDFAGISFRSVLFGFVAVALLGAILQAGILHYRGAFNNPFMYVPLTAPLLAVGVSAWTAFAPENDLANTILSVLLWLTFLIGFIGLGMHLRGLERQMGGLYLWRFNLLEGAPVSAPFFFLGLAMVGLATIYLLK